MEEESWRAICLTGETKRTTEERRPAEVPREEGRGKGFRRASALEEFHKKRRKGVLRGEEVREEDAEVLEDFGFDLAIEGL